MILTSVDLPSKGTWGNKNPISLRPLTFLEILEYNSEVTGNTVKNYLRDIKWLLKLDPMIAHLSLYDLDYLIFMMKVHTISGDSDFTASAKCKECKSESPVKFSFENFHFKDVEDFKHVKEVTLGHTSFHISMPTIDQFKKVLGKYDLYKKTDEADIAKIISLFSDFDSKPNLVEDSIFNATREDISILVYLESTYLTSVEPVRKTCPHCNKEGGIVIRIDNLIANLFREVLRNSKSVEYKILFE